MSLLSSPLARLAAAVSLTAAAGLAAVAAAAPASAAACTTTGGVTVIADFNQLGGGISAVCVGDGGGKAASALFDTAGLTLTYAQRQPGFVCRVVAKPASDPCVNTSPANAYWGLWWSDGDAGSGWTYSTLGVGSLKVPSGGLVAFAWDEVSGDERPSAASTRPAPAPAPAPSPSPSPSPDPAPSPSAPSATSGGSGGGPRSTSTPTPDPSTTSDEDGTTEESAPGVPEASGSGSAPKNGQGAGKRGDGSGDRSPDRSGDDTDAAPGSSETETSETPEAAETSEAPDVTSADPAPTAESEAASQSDDGLPGWTAPALIVILFGAAAVAWLVRRRATAGL